ncbi:MAG: NAD(P)H-hydrate dehydratase [Lachnospiraceae bacterium]
MKYSVTGIQMKQIDRYTISQIGIPSMVLMERAALEVVKDAELLADGNCRCHIWSVCGTGNNGADGIAAGRMLHQKGYQVTVILAGNAVHRTEEQKAQISIAEQIGVTLIEYEDVIPGTCDIIIDAIFGIGLTRPVDGSYRSLIEMLQKQKNSRVVAVDIPSGIHADTGQVMGTAMKADRTVTFGYYKSGLLTYPGRSYAGTLRIADIGFPEQGLKQSGWDAMVLEPADLQYLPERTPDGNKGTFGRLLLIAGSAGMSGAAYLSAYSAYRMGAGLVRIITVEENRQILQTQLPEAVIETFSADQAQAPEFIQWLEEQIDWATAIAAGPGLGREPHVKLLVETILTHAYVPLVLDADALNTISEYPELSGYYTDNMIVTPHIGEMARLTNKSIPELKEDPLTAAREYSSQYGVTCVLKDAATVIANQDGDTWLNASGNSGMAKAGSGDVLTGIIGALLVQGMEISDAAAFGVYLHGCAGDAAVRQLGAYGLLASDIADFINPSLKGSEDT